MITDTERLAAIERLKINKQLCEEFNFLGENNHEKIDVKIDVLEHQRDKDWIYKNYKDKDIIGKRSSALSALKFLGCKTQIDEILYPETKNFDEKDWEKIWDLTKPKIEGINGKVIITSTPTCSNQFYDMWKNSIKEEDKDRFDLWENNNQKASHKMPQYTEHVINSEINKTLT